MQQQAEQARLPELRQAAPKPPITCGTQATDTLIDRSSQPSSQPIFPAADRMSPGEETIDRALRDEEPMQIQRALSREALEEEQAVLKLKELQAQEAWDAEEMAKLEARMQQRQLESQAQAKAALLARSRSQSSLCSEPATSAGSPPAPSTQKAARTGTASSPSEPSAARAAATGKDAACVQITGCNDRRWLSREEAAKAACCLDAFISSKRTVWPFRVASQNSPTLPLEKGTVHCAVGCSTTLGSSSTMASSSTASS